MLQKKSYNVTIDCRLINASGIGTYIKNILPSIIKKLDSNKYFLLGNNTTLFDQGLLDHNNVECIEFNAPIYSIKEQLQFQKLIPKETDLFWAPHYNIPILYNGKVLVSIMDLGHLALKQINHETIKRIYSKFMFNRIKKKATATIYISIFSKNEYNKFIGRPNSDQFVTLLGVNNDWKNIPENKSLSLKPFILYVGNVKPHKNLGRLIEAYKIICDRIPHDLVIVGKNKGFITGDNTLIQKIKNYSDRIRFTGKVNDTDLKQYYKQAELFVFPSIYEGFGLPPLEAMAAGTPVLSSDAASMPEICGDAVLYFNPYDINQLAQKILEILNNDELVMKYITRGRKHVEKYTWDKTAFQTSNIIKNLLERD